MFLDSKGDSVQGVLVGEGEPDSGYFLVLQSLGAVVEGGRVVDGFDLNIQQFIFAEGLVETQHVGSVDYLIREEGFDCVLELGPIGRVLGTGVGVAFTQNNLPYLLFGVNASVQP